MAQHCRPANTHGVARDILPGLKWTREEVDADKQGLAYWDGIRQPLEMAT